MDEDWPEENDGGMDMNKSIAAENTKGCLEKKKISLANFLNRKLIEIGNRKSAARNLTSIQAN